MQLRPLFPFLGSPVRHRSRPFQQLRALALGAAAGPLLLGAGAPPPAPASATVTVTVKGVRNAKGVIRACMTDKARGFPAKCSDHRLVVPAAGTVQLTFPDVPPGRYAIALLHDENGNGKADRALGMMPKEGFGFSRDAKVRMGPPSFDDAAFEVSGTDSAQVIHMRYMF